MSQDELHHLIDMANQISRNSQSDDDEGIQFVASHLQRFWARSMKAKLRAYAESDGSELEPHALAAAKRLK